MENYQHVDDYRIKDASKDMKNVGFGAQ